MIILSQSQCRLSGGPGAGLQGTGHRIGVIDMTASLAHIHGVHIYVYMQSISIASLTGFGNWKSADTAALPVT